MSGEFSTVAFRTVELITLTFKKMVSKQYFEGGTVLKRWATAFRTDFKVREKYSKVQRCSHVCHFSGFGHTLSVTDRPCVGHHLSSLGANCGIPDWEVIY